MLVTKLSPPLLLLLLGWRTTTACDLDIAWLLKRVCDLDLTEPLFTSHDPVLFRKSLLLVTWKVLIQFSLVEQKLEFSWSSFNEIRRQMQNLEGIDSRVCVLLLSLNPTVTIRNFGRISPLFSC